MRAARVPRAGTIEVVTWPDPVMSDSGQVIVRVEVASICGSDLHAVFEGNTPPGAGGIPGFPGHEAVGTVVESSSSRIAVGDRVLCVPEGQEGCCFAELALLDDDHVLPLPAGEARHLVLAQQYGTVLWAMKHFWPREDPPRRRGVAVVIGCGPAGLLFVGELLAAGFEAVIATDLRQDRMEIAERLGAIGVLTGHNDLRQVVGRITAGEGADLVVDAVGTSEARAAAIPLVAVGGIIGCFGVPQGTGPEPWDVASAFRRSARIQYIQSAQAEPGLASFAEAVRRIAAAEVDLGYLGNGPDLALDDLPDAMAQALTRTGPLKRFLWPGRLSLRPA